MCFRPTQNSFFNNHFELIQTPFEVVAEKKKPRESIGGARTVTRQHCTHRGRISFTAPNVSSISELCIFPGPAVEVGITMYVLSISSLSEVKMVLKLSVSHDLDPNKQPPVDFGSRH